MPSDRIRRVNEAVREVLSEAIAGGLKDPRIGFVTVTSVETSPDLRHANVFVSVLGDEEARSETLAGLDDSRKLLQTALAHQLRIKNTPRLRFVYDDSVERGLRVAQLIDEIAQESHDDE